MVYDAIVIDDFVGLLTSIRTDNELGFTINDPIGKFLGREPSENDHMGRSYSGAGQHSDDTLNYHWHVNDDSVTWDDLELTLQSACKVLHSPMKFSVGDCAPLS